MLDLSFSQTPESSDFFGLSYKLSLELLPPFDTSDITLFSKTL